MSGPSTDSSRRTALQRLLSAVTTCAVRFPVVTLAVCFVTAVAAVWHTQQRLEFKTSRADLIDPRTAYHQRWLNYTREFGDVTEDMVVVVEGSDAADIGRAIDELGPRIEHETRLFKNVLYKVDLSGLRQKALQYSSPEQLQLILSQLDEFSPLLRRFDQLTLRGLLRELRLAIPPQPEQAEKVAPQLIESLLQHLSLILASLERFAQDPSHYDSPWQSVVPGDLSQLETMFRDRYLMNDKGTMGFLKVQSTTAASDFSGATPSIDRLRGLLSETQRRHAGTRLGLTGIPVLESDEMRDSQTAMFYASVISFVGVALLMILGFQGLRYPLIGSAVLLVGMAWSFGFTTLAIGHLNILSVSFAAMLIGIGIDYTTVYLLRYLELRHTGLATAEALHETACSSGAGICTAAISSALAFFCAIFTDFAGVSELGVIAGAGILICTVAAFVVLPAILMLVDRRHETQKLPRPLESRRLRWLIAHAPVALIVVCGGTIAWISTFGLELKYDYNLLHLQSKGLESVEIQSRIFEQSDSSLLFAVSLADNPQQVLDLKRKFEALPSVHHVEELAAILPRFPSTDTQLLVQAVHAELSNLPVRPPIPQDVAPLPIAQELEQLEAALARLDSPSAASVRGQIDRFLDRLDRLGVDPQGRASVKTQVQLLRDYQTRLTADLLAKLRGLESISTTEPVAAGDLSPTLVSRLVSPNGKWLLQVYPASEIWDIEPLEKFISDVRAVDPEATGTPLQTFEASKAIKRSYETIGLYALFTVCILLWIDFRNLLDSLLALVPPLAGAALMFGLLALLHVDLNPANLIVLPLVIGLGVDGGVHVVHDYRSQQGLYAPSASVINAIIVNATTTMVGFGSMMIAAHRGLYSLGLVVTIGVGTCLVVAVILLPAMLTVISRWRHQSVVSTVPTIETMTAESIRPERVRETSFPAAPHSPLTGNRTPTPWTLAPSRSFAEE
ncbi:MAG: hypothetical protein EXS05_00650 [Planctomycetaceae bacterium]|nr:hypothetical protein [Planctomycetaceae bacterium]